MKKLFKIALWCFGIGLVIGLATLYYVFNKPHRHVGSEKPAFIGSADSIIAEFARNEQASFIKFDNKAIEVYGVINDITIEPSKVELVFGSMGEGISCSFDSAFIVDHYNIISKYKSGDSIYLQGKCDGHDDIMGTVLTQCVIVR